MKTLSIAETRRDFCSLASDVIESGESIVISRYGTPCLILTRYTPEIGLDKPQSKPVRCEDTPGFGMWADRGEMDDPREWLQRMRNRRMERYQ